MTFYFLFLSTLRIVLIVIYFFFSCFRSLFSVKFNFCIFSHFFFFHDLLSKRTIIPKNFQFPIQIFHYSRPDDRYTILCYTPSSSGKDILIILLIIKQLKLNYVLYGKFGIVLCFRSRQLNYGSGQFI
jgi:hypothetical protein